MLQQLSETGFSITVSSGWPLHGAKLFFAIASLGPSTLQKPNFQKFQNSPSPVSSKLTCPPEQWVLIQLESDHFVSNDCQSIKRFFEKWFLADDHNFYKTVFKSIFLFEKNFPLISATCLRTGLGFTTAGWEKKAEKRGANGVKMTGNVLLEFGIHLNTRRQFATRWYTQTQRNGCGSSVHWNIEHRKMFWGKLFFF